MQKKLESFITTFSTQDELKEKLSLVWEKYINIEIDWHIISNQDKLYELIYGILETPKTFWYNWDAFRDTIRDQEFWVKEKLVIIIRNKLYLLSEEYLNRSSDIFDSLMVELINLDWYFVFIEKYR